MTVHKDLVERLRQAALIPRPTVKEKQLILFAADILEKLTDENNVFRVSGIMAIEAYGATQALEELEDELKEMHSNYLIQDKYELADVVDAVFTKLKQIRGKYTEVSE
ncbi:MAG: hypothetical protein IJX38_03695 [Clostridia bacterium]|nr:hypothetical protein [Clostridia bacterium]